MSSDPCFLLLSVPFPPQHGCPRDHPPGDGTRVPFLHGPGPGAGLPVPLPLHGHRLQLLLLHLPGPSRQPRRVSRPQSHLLRDPNSNPRPRPRCDQPGRPYPGLSRNALAILVLNVRCSVQASFFLLFWFDCPSVRLYHMLPVPTMALNPLTPKSDQLQISPAASPEI